MNSAPPIFNLVKRSLIKKTQIIFTRTESRVRENYGIRLVEDPRYEEQIEVMELVSEVAGGHV